MKSNNTTMVYISLATAMISLVSNFVQSKIHSIYLKEDIILFFMNKMTANNRWYPFNQLIKDRRYESNINFGDLNVNYPCLTHAFGYQRRLEFIFNDTMLDSLLSELIIWENEMKNKPLVTDKLKYELRFTTACLKNVSLNMLVHFIHEFPGQIYELNLNGINWRKLVKDKQENGLITVDNLNDPLTPKGKSLLQICIDNEKK